jgi:hypothetical protein
MHALEQAHEEFAVALTHMLTALARYLYVRTRVLQQQAYEQQIAMQQQAAYAQQVQQQRQMQQQQQQGRAQQVYLHHVRVVLRVCESDCALMQQHKIV